MKTLQETSKKAVLNQIEQVDKFQEEEIVVRTYTSLHAAVMESSNGYEAGTLTRTPEQLSQLLQL